MVSKRKIIIAIFLGCFGIIMVQAVSAATCPAIDGTLNCASVGKVACGGTCVLASSIATTTCTTSFDCSACRCADEATPTPVQPWSVNPRAANAIYNNLNSSVGIGTMYPGEALDVNGAITVNNNNSQLFGWDGGYGYVGGIRMNQNYDSKVGYDTIVRNGPSGLMLLNQYGLSISAAPYRVTGAKFYDGTYGNLFIGNNAKIGIGTTNPVYSLSVDNNFNGNNAIIATNINSGTGVASMVGAGNGGTIQDVVRVAAYGTAFTTNGSAKQDGAELRAGPNLTGGLSITSMSTNANADIRFYTGGAGDANQRMVIESTGNVGIGAVGAQRALHISTPLPEIQFTNTNSPNKSWHIGGYNNDFAITETDVATRMIVKEGGNVGIGTSTPTSKLHVSGGLRVTSSSTLGSTVIDGRTIAFVTGGSAWIGTQDSNVFALRTNKTNRITIDGSGNVGIGTSASTSKLHVSGGLRVTSSSTLGSTVIDGRTIAFVTGGSAWIGTQDSNVFALRTNKTNRITIDGSGNVGIGKMPSQALDVSGNITGSGEINGQYLHIKGGGANDIAGSLSINDGSGSLDDGYPINGRLQLRKTPAGTALPGCSESNRGEMRIRECSTNAATACKDRIIVCVWHDNGVGDNGSFQWIAASWDGVAQ